MDELTVYKAACNYMALEIYALRNIVGLAYGHLLRMVEENKTEEEPSEEVNQLLMKMAKVSQGEDALDASV